MSRNADPKRTPQRPCPICGKPSEASWRPFCSKRCADIDLGRWLGERYAIPGEPGESGEPTAAPGRSDAEESD
ncbi:MAG TPA: DNA gyrase inhibitor YacG [Thermohalobaculum sp.]|nr:DNA gyrase inhibitor YacG [Thermohalobaculum sp.]